MPIDLCPGGGVLATLRTTARCFIEGTNTDFAGTDTPVNSLLAGLAYLRRSNGSSLGVGHCSPSV